MHIYSPSLQWLLPLMNAQLASGRGLSSWYDTVFWGHQPVSRQQVDYILPLLYWGPLRNNTYSDYGFAFPIHNASASTTICRLPKCYFYWQSNIFIEKILINGLYPGDLLVLSCTKCKNGLTEEWNNLLKTQQQNGWMVAILWYSSKDAPFAQNLWLVQCENGGVSCHLFSVYRHHVLCSHNFGLKHKEECFH